MLWLYLTLGAQFFNALAALLDKVLVTKRFPSPAVLTFWTAVANLLGLFFIFFDFNFYASGTVIFWAIISGVSFSVALYFFYSAIKKGEATHVAPFVGGLIPLFSILFSYFILQERLSGPEWFGVIFLVIGTFLISFEKSEKYNGWHKGLVWAILASICFSFFYVTGRFSYLQDSFSTGFVWARLGSFLVVLPLFFSEKFRKVLFSREKNKREVRKSFFLLAVNKASSAIYFVAINYAVSLSSATIVNALSGLQYVILFFMVALLTKFSPKRFTEKIYSSEFVLQIISLIFIGVGLYFLV